jgi:hypothetical protein
MSNRYHAGQKYTQEQQAQLDEAYHAWLTVEAAAEYGSWSNKTMVQASISTFAAYEALLAEFAAANEPLGNNGEPLITSEWQPGDDALAEQAEEAAYMHSHPGNGWGL